MCLEIQNDEIDYFVCNWESTVIRSNVWEKTNEPIRATNKEYEVKLY